MNQSINTDSKNSKEPQKKYRLGTVSIKILGGVFFFFILLFVENLRMSYVVAIHICNTDTKIPSISPDFIFAVKNTRFKNAVP